MKAIIIVTQDDIDRGKRGKCETCPIARAMKRVLNVENVKAKYGHLFFEKNGEVYMAMTPSIARNFIADFDAGDLSVTVKPFSFLAVFNRISPGNQLWGDWDIN